MEKITREELLKLAQISQIHVQEHEIDSLIEDISAVLSYASSLKEIALAARERYPLPKNSAVMRDDVVVPSNSELILQNAPEREGNFFVVPRIIKQG